MRYDEHACLFDFMKSLQQLINQTINKNTIAEMKKIADATFNLLGQIQQLALQCQTYEYWNNNWMSKVFSYLRIIQDKINQLEKHPRNVRKINTNIKLIIDEIQNLNNLYREINEKVHDLII